MACPDRGAGGRPRAYSCLHERCLPSTFATSPWAPQYRLSPVRHPLRMLPNETQAHPERHRQTRSHAHSAARSSPSSRSSLTSPPGSSAVRAPRLPHPAARADSGCTRPQRRACVRCRHRGVPQCGAVLPVLCEVRVACVCACPSLKLSRRAGRIRCTPPALCTCEGWPDMRGRRSGVPLFGYSYVPNRTTLAMTVCAPAPSHMDALDTKPMA